MTPRPGEEQVRRLIEAREIEQTVDAMRRRRRDAEYPQDSGDAVDAEEVRATLPKSRAIVEYAAVLLPHLEPW